MYVVCSRYDGSRYPEIVSYRDILRTRVLSYVWSEMSQNTQKWWKSVILLPEGDYTSFPCLDKEKARFCDKSSKQRFFDGISDIFENIALSASSRRSARSPRGGRWGPVLDAGGLQLGQNRVKSGPESVRIGGPEVPIWAGIWQEKRVSDEIFVSRR